MIEEQSLRPSDVIEPFDNLKAGDLVFIKGRVSARGAQKKRENNSDQHQNLVEVVEARGAIVVGFNGHIGSGQDLTHPRFIEAIEQAERHGAILLAENTSRFVRHPRFKTTKERRHLQATSKQLGELARRTIAIRLMTHLDPDASNEEMHLYMTMRGRDQKKNKGGRPVSKKERRRIKKPSAIELRQKGLSVRVISKKIGVPRATVQEWLSE